MFYPTLQFIKYAGYKYSDVYYDKQLCVLICQLFLILHNLDDVNRRGVRYLSIMYVWISFMWEKAE